MSAHIYLGLWAYQGAVAVEVGFTYDIYTYMAFTLITFIVLALRDWNWHHWDVTDELGKRIALISDDPANHWYIRLMNLVEGGFFYIFLTAGYAYIGNDSDFSFFMTLIGSMIGFSILGVGAIVEITANQNLHKHDSLIN